MAMATEQTRGVRPSFAAGELRRLAGFYAVIAALHVMGWGMLIFLVAPEYPSALGLGVGFTAYLLGLRHAFDADHIAAIDNTTRKLMADGKQPLGVGFFFAMGHSAVVFGLALALAFAAQQVAAQLSEGSALSTIGGLIGTGLSALFLYLIALLNVVVLVDVLRIFMSMRNGTHDDAGLNAQVDASGFMNRFLGRLSRAVGSSWHMFPIGFLFGLGFNTASEVALLTIAAGAASTGLPFYAIVCLPTIFAAGMSAMDTADGAFIGKAYGWAFSNPIRKIYYNITVTGLSIVVAFLIGSIELLGIIQERFDLSGPFWRFIASLDLGFVGYFIVGLFVVSWAVSYAVWKFGRIEERWQQPHPER